MKPILICGVDEVGRGAAAGPILSVAALFWCGNDQPPVEGIQDSKAFKGASGRKSRRQVFRSILGCAELVSMGVGYVGPELIDKKGIDWANQESFRRALEKLTKRPEFIIVDGTNKIEGWADDKQLAEPKADANYWQVGAASILAKEIRDQAMAEMHCIYDQYGWNSNMGYLSETHLAGLKAYGPVAFHRRSFLKTQCPSASRQPVSRFR